MKVIIQIPCYNEEESLPVALAALPRELPRVDVVEWLVVDDGSTDRTSDVARAHGVEHVIRLPRHRGLAHAFMAGLEGSLQAGADIIVNTDADNQYRASDIPKLIEPILDGRAEMVIGARPIDSIRHFSRLKKSFQRLGSWVTRAVSSTTVYDAPSGFRAISRGAAMRLHVFNGFTYTIENQQRPSAIAPDQGSWWVHRSAGADHGKGVRDLQAFQVLRRSRGGSFRHRVPGGASLPVLLHHRWRGRTRAVSDSFGSAPRDGLLPADRRPVGRPSGREP
jgi:glycosyltransferase involved in cell wall biosynthesis